MRKSHGVGPNILVSGNRKRSAPSAQVENDQQASTVQASTPENNANISSAFAGKESAWNLKDCIFIHEEAINDTSIVKIVCYLFISRILFF